MKTLIYTCSLLSLLALTGCDREAYGAQYCPTATPYSVCRPDAVGINPSASHQSPGNPGGGDGGGTGGGDGGSSHDNNGCGNGDQNAPGNSGSHNNAENNHTGKSDPSHGRNK